MLAGAAATWLHRYARAARHARGARHRNRRGLRGGARAAGGRGVRRRHRRRACAAERRGRAARARRASRCCCAATVLGTSGRLRVNADAARAPGEGVVTSQRDSALRPGADVRGLHPERAPLLAVARQAASGTRRCRHSCPGCRPSACAAPAPAAACSGSQALLADGAAAGAAAAREALDPARRGVIRGRRRARRAAHHRTPADTTPPAASRLARARCPCRAAAARAGVRRLAERCDHARIWRSRRARAFAPSSTSSAIRRPAWRPIRARPPT